MWKDKRGSDLNPLQYDLCFIEWLFYIFMQYLLIYENKVVSYKSDI